MRWRRSADSSRSANTAPWPPTAAGMVGMGRNVLGSHADIRRHELETVLGSTVQGMVVRLPGYVLQQVWGMDGVSSTTYVKPILGCLIDNGVMFYALHNVCETHSILGAESAKRLTGKNTRRCANGPCCVWTPKSRRSTFTNALVTESY